MKMSTQTSSSSWPAHPLGFSWKIVLGKQLQKCWQLCKSFSPKDLVRFYYPNRSDGLESPHLYWAAEWEMRSKCETSDSSFVSDIETRERRRKLGFSVPPSSPSSWSLSRRLLVMEQAPHGASEPLCSWLQGGGTKSCGFEGPALISFSATSCDWQINPAAHRGREIWKAFPTSVSQTTDNTSHVRPVFTSLETPFWIQQQTC